jgi:hypothetical protein
MTQVGEPQQSETGIRTSWVSLLPFPSLSEGKDPSPATQATVIGIKGYIPTCLLQNAWVVRPKVVSEVLWSGLPII